MANITITIPDQHVQRVLDAFTALPDYPDSGLGAAAFAKAKVIAYLREQVLTYEGAIAAQAAVEQVKTEIGGIGIS